jgi:four helix bundle protein
MTVRDYRELIGRQKASRLATLVYWLSARSQRDERLGLTSQMRCSGVSVPSNIAEGQGRGTTDDFVRFLGMARGSLCELDTRIYLAEQLGFLNAEAASQTIAQTTEVSKLINGRRKALNDKNQPVTSKH